VVSLEQPGALFFHQDLSFQSLYVAPTL
jgi:hypothetical protein